MSVCDVSAATAAATLAATEAVVSLTTDELGVDDDPAAEAVD